MLELNLELLLNMGLNNRGTIKECSQLPFLVNLALMYCHVPFKNYIIVSQLNNISYFSHAQGFKLVSVVDCDQREN